MPRIISHVRGSHAHAFSRTPALGSSMLSSACTRFAGMHLGCPNIPRPGRLVRVELRGTFSMPIALKPQFGSRMGWPPLESASAAPVVLPHQPRFERRQKAAKRTPPSFPPPPARRRPPPGRRCLPLPPRRPPSGERVVSALSSFVDVGGACGDLHDVASERRKTTRRWSTSGRHELAARGASRCGAAVRERTMRCQPRVCTEFARRHADMASMNSWH